MRISLTGTHSVGKTTLLQKLGAHYNIPIIQEYARDILERHTKFWTDMNVTERLCFEAAICNAQWHGFTKQEGPFISDRTPLDIMGYMELTYFEHTKEIDENEALKDLYKGCGDIIRKLNSLTLFDVIIFLRDFDKTDWRKCFIDDFLGKALLNPNVNVPVIQLRSKSDYANVEDVVKRIERLGLY